jgi:hypothetical protein
MRKLNIGLIGNLSVPYSTENERRWSFERLGHRVITFQENKTTSRDLLRIMNKLDMLIYSHTHGWEILGLKDVFGLYKEAGVPTASIHLDRWAWLDRVKDVGKEATWSTEYVFMADGSPEAVELYKKHNLNWYFLKAGVVERDCYMAQPDLLKFPYEIVFTGSKQYNPEYPERPALIDWLHATYGNRFGHYGNDGIKVVRGEELNTLYASAKIVIGDSCFGGRPHYVSDRYYEVRGRGGFLLHPLVEGMDNMGIANYNPRDKNDLKRQIDFYLEHNIERELLRMVGFDWVRNNETYTYRAKEILRIIFAN